MGLGDGHDLQSPRFSGLLTLEACYDGEYRMLDGEAGQAVLEVQLALLDLGYPLPVHGADAIYGPETASAVAKFKADRGIVPSDGVVGPGTMAALDTLFKLDPTVIVVENCPPPFVLTVGKAATCSEYAQLVSCVERARPELTPRQILSYLRQCYYRGGHWPEVIPCGQDLGEVSSVVERTLYEAVKGSKILSDGFVQTDVGHLFTGLEAMCCPSPTVTIVGAVAVTVNIPNEEFASWVGDLGQAVATKAFDEIKGSGATLPWEPYFGPTGNAAPFSDLEGDIDGYAVRQALTGVACANSALTRVEDRHLALPLSMSVILEEYYGALATPIGQARAQRFNCFAQSIGCHLSGRRISNKEELTPVIAARVAEFASWFLVSLLSAISFAVHGTHEALLQVYSIQITRLFLNWVEGNLQ
jgi:hypothetical protein